MLRSYRTKNTHSFSKLRYISFFILLHLAFCQATAQTYRVATFNMRYDAPADTLNPWKERLPVIVQMIRFYDFDVFGGQELLKHQIDGLMNELNNYAYTGVGRDDGKSKGEYSPVIYNKEKFTLLESGTFWLSPEPGKPGKGWDADLPRVCSWAKLQDNDNKFSFYFFSTHFDHKGVKARHESAKLILNMTDKIAGSSPAVLAGDFNFDQFSDNYQVIDGSKMFSDTHSLAATKMDLNGTFNQFNIGHVTDRRIDHLFVTSSFHVQRWGVLTNAYKGKYPSDHFPVMAEISVDK